MICEYCGEPLMEADAEEYYFGEFVHTWCAESMKREANEELASEINIDIDRGDY